MKFQDLYQATKRRASVVIDSVTGKVVAVGTGLSVMAGNAMAAVDPLITTAITDGTADGKEIAGGLLVFAVAVGIVLYIKRKAG
ncbi:major capsid protein [Thiobacillus denitrificans]|uniref:major capsid protein n=1 Tax=Thiobacillus denitrificans TaxID=36861 RepID=UPI00037349B3|nr:major capsid protein [Thiobacillus denitrificans]